MGASFPFQLGRDSLKVRSPRRSAAIVRFEIVEITSVETFDN